MTDEPKPILLSLEEVNIIATIWPETIELSDLATAQAIGRAFRDGLAIRAAEVGIAPDVLARFVAGAA